jgi:hypothetical protein
MMKKTNLTRVAIASVLILIAAMTRLLPHEPNFTPILGIAIFGAAMFTTKRWLMFAIPFAAMFITDLILGISALTLFTYGSIAMIIGISALLMKKVSFPRVIGSSLLAAVVFFVVTNFGYWLMFDLYAHSLQGLILCYEMAVPFFRSTLLSTLITSGAMFGAHYLVEHFMLKPATQS